MNAFEKLIEATFGSLREAGVASVRMLYPPMRAAGMLGRMPCYIPAGKSPYDAGGFYFDETGTAIGAELKETKDHETSLAIVGPDKKGSGIQYHQLDSLVQLHRAGGVALLVWSNGGEIGVLRGDALTLVKLQYDASLKAEKAKKDVAKGSRSIPWAMFKPVKYGSTDEPLWLPPSPQPCKKKAS